MPAFLLLVPSLTTSSPSLLLQVGTAVEDGSDRVQWHVQVELTVYLGRRRLASDEFTGEKERARVIA